MSRPQFRLRIDNVRVFYDVKKDTVEILAIISKKQADRWLGTQGGGMAKRLSRPGPPARSARCLVASGADLPTTLDANTLK